MRKPVGLFVAAFATVAGGGLAMAVEGQSAPPDETPPPVAAEEGQDNGVGTEPGPPEEQTVEVTDTTDTTEDTAVEETLEGDGGEHGAWVSDHAQNICNDPATVNPETGEAFRNHGECVSFAARDKDHDGTPDVPAEDETVEETEEPEVEDGEPGAGHRTSGGAGHRSDSPGRGHARHGG